MLFHRYFFHKISQYSQFSSYRILFLIRFLIRITQNRIRNKQTNKQIWWKIWCVSFGFTTLFRFYFIFFFFHYHHTSLDLSRFQSADSVFFSPFITSSSQRKRKENSFEFPSLQMDLSKLLKRFRLFFNKSRLKTLSA